MQVIQEIIEVKETYVAEDGRKFKSKDACSIYEKYSKIDLMQLVEKYVKVSAATREKIDKRQFPKFEYALGLEEMPYDMQRYLKMTQLDEIVPIVTGKNLYYCDWTNAFSGGYGFNGWIDLGTKESLEIKKSRIQAHLDNLSQLMELD
jgi:hypothetical protein